MIYCYLCTYLCIFRKTYLPGLTTVVVDPFVLSLRYPPFYDKEQHTKTIVNTRIQSNTQICSRKKTAVIFPLF